MTLGIAHPSTRICSSKTLYRGRDTLFLYRKVNAMTIRSKSMERIVQTRGWDRIILGLEASKQQSIGFGSNSVALKSSLDYVTYRGAGHLMTVAPTRSGKGVGTVICNSLLYAGPIILFDPKGEAYMVSARRRRELGHQVIKIDPFGVIDETTDSINPFDIFDLEGSDLESDAQVLAELIAASPASTKDPFWDMWGRAIQAGIIALVATTETGQKRTMESVLHRFQNEDVVYELAKTMDSIGKKMNAMAWREIASLLAMPEVTRGGVLATAQSYLKSLMSPAAMRSVSASTFSLSDVVSGKPLTIYLIIPPDRLVSHRFLLRIWVGTLMKAILSRRNRPALNTLMLIDEAAQLGHYPMLETIISLGAGYSCWLHLVYQDLSQLQNNFPTSWRTLMNGCEVIQAFGFRNRDMATQWSEILDQSPGQLRCLSDQEQILSIQGQGEIRCQKLNYLTDRAFRGMFDDNRFYDLPKKLLNPLCKSLQASQQTQ